MTQGSPCPDADELQRLANNQLSAAEAFRLQRHLVRCADCTGMVEALRDANKALTTTSASANPSMVSNPTSPLPPPAPVAPPPNEGDDFLAPAQAPDEIGRLGNYRVLRLLGAGGMGMVFAAEDLHLQRKVALKVMRPRAGEDDDNRQRFLRESRLAAALEHENIVTVYQAGEDRGVLYLAMQLLQGENLEDRLTIAHRLPVADVLRIARETAEGLRSAHDRGLVHRDIKPSNLWLESRPTRAGQTNYRVKILDFGLARDIGGGSDQVTRTGFVVGTAGYIAPEQARGRPPDARSDIFSLGCVLYEACTGRCPFQGEDAMSRLTALAVEHPASPQQINPEVPPKLATLVLWMLAKEPNERPNSAREVIEAVDAIEEELRGEAADTPPPSRRGKPLPAAPKPAATPAAAPPSDSQGSSMTIYIIAIAVLTAIIGFLGFQLLRG
jgi:serine/threonine protein kinase